MKRLIVSALFCSLFFNGLLARAETLDKIVAIVEDDVILDRELQQEVEAIVQRMKASNAQLPPSFILRKQVLEKMIKKESSNPKSRESVRMSLQTPCSGG